MNFEHTLHALIATLYQRQYEIARRLLDDPSDIALHAEIPNGALLTQWLTHDEDDEIFEALDKLGFLEREAAPGSYDYYVHALKLQYPTLREQLAREALSDSVDEQWLVGCFIRYAVRMDRHDVLGNVRLAGLPIHKDWFPVPSYYVEAMRDIAAVGYCEFEAGKAKWLPAVSAIMEARGCWIEDRTADEVRQDYLIEIWHEMPNEIRRLTLLDSDSPHAMALATFMSYFWDKDEGWHFDPDVLATEILADEAKISLRGGYFALALEISKAVKSALLP
ncbi:hypothetical protein [Sphingopyxis sp. GC21]|uniref:hypothetical protein n=1 Tax=Sphingopyxis sp. GC21 TaxID=2933562 RepID=UPI0021E37010|nr:hypothetical protein [Sphingopyxis sp. GC21]